MIRSVRAGTPVSIGDVELIPLEETIVTIEWVGRTLVATAVKQPVGVEITAPSRRWTLDLEGQPLSGWRRDR